MEKYNKDWKDILDIVLDSTQWLYFRVFDEPSKDNYSFHHQLIQEYFAACALWEAFKIEDMGRFEKGLEKLPYQSVIADLLDEMLDDHEEVFEYCMDKIEEGLKESERRKESITDRGHFYTWVLTLRDKKAEKGSLGDELQKIFDEELRRTQKDAEVQGKFVRIPAGPFFMWSYEYDEEQPVHIAYVREYWISRYAETFGEYEEFRQTLKGQENISRKFYGARRPAVNVTWEEAREYCMEFQGGKYELPSEAQWEKAARGISGGGTHGVMGNRTKCWQILAVN